MASRAKKKVLMSLDDWIARPVEQQCLLICPSGNTGIGYEARINDLLSNGYHLSREVNTCEGTLLIFERDKVGIE